MMLPQNQGYVEEREGEWYVRGQRVPVTALAIVWNQGASPEAIVNRFPVLTLAEVYGAVAFYLDHQSLIDQRITEDIEEFARQREAARSQDPAWYTELERRMDARRAQKATSAS